MTEMTEVRCCCEPQNLIGMIPAESGEAAGLTLRELKDGTFAYDSNHDADAVRQLEGFVEAPEAAKKPKEWKKTWRK